jgi:hypothetical protein
MDGHYQPERMLLSPQLWADLVEVPITKIIEDNSLKNVEEIDDYEFRATLCEEETRMAMRHAGLNMEFTFKKEDVLKQLRKNREEHALIVEEARDGWQTAAVALIKKELANVRKATAPAQLSFHLNPPVDYTDVYDTLIAQLEMAQEDELELDGDQFRKMMEDKWDWREQFLGTNAAYSVSAAMAFDD